MGYTVLYLTDLVTEYEDEMELDAEERDEYTVEEIESVMGQVGADDLDSFASIANDDPGLISDYGFDIYAQDTAESIGAIDPDAGWPLYHIDWEEAAKSLQMDYYSVDYRGETYWMQSY